MKKSVLVLLAIGSLLTGCKDANRSDCLNEVRRSFCKDTLFGTDCSGAINNPAYLAAVKECMDENK